MITRPPFGVVPVGDMFQQEIDEIFKDLPNLFGNADGIWFLYSVMGIDAAGQPKYLQASMVFFMQLNNAYKLKLGAATTFWQPFVALF